MLPQAERSSGAAARQGIMYNYTNVLVPSRRVLVTPGDHPLRIPGHADLRLAVSHGEVQDERGPVHLVHPRLVSHERTSYVCEGLSMRVIPPLPPYSNMTEEPDDNTHAARAKRYAMVTLVHEGTEKVTPLHVWLLCYAFWTLWSEQEYFTLRIDGAPDRDAWVPSTLLSGLASPHPADTAAVSPPGAASSTGTILVSRAAFWQGAGPRNAGKWLPVLDVLPDINVPPSVMTPENACADGIRRSASHPHRTPKVGPWDSLNPDACTTPIYSRYIPEFDQTLTYRLVSPNRESDVDLVHKWHATDRVSAGWRQNYGREQHRQYLEAISKSSDQMALIGEWDGEPWGYVEVYWSLVRDPSVRLLLTDSAGIGIQQLLFGRRLRPRLSHPCR